jgi:hypothetical protein
MTDGRSKKAPKPTRKSPRWTSFVGVAGRGRAIRQLQDEKNPKHRAKVEHNQDTLLIHVSNEDGGGWTTIAIDRATREWSVAQRKTQMAAAVAAHSNLYD